MSISASTQDRRQLLAERFDGILTGPGDAAYDETRRCYNGLVDKRPAIIATCRGTADVVEAVRFATGQGLDVAVRGGGHNAAGRAMCDDGLVVDLSLMRGVDVDPETRTARVQGGALWRDVNRETGVHGLAVTGGAISTTGVGGYTLGGGLGWLMGLHGLAADNLVEAEVVLATGEVVRARADHHEDLFWAIRGGGGNFGVVTSFALRLHHHPEVVGGVIAHPLDAAADMLRFYREVTADVPDALTVFAAVLHAPDGSGVPLGALLVCHAGERAQAERDVQRLAEWGSPVMAEVGPMPYPAVNTMLDAGFPPGSLNYWKSTFVRDLDDGLFELMVHRIADCPSPMTGILLEHFHGEVTRVDPAATAVPHRRPGYNLLIPSLWTDPATTDANVRWVRETFAATAPYRAGARWLNYFDDDEEPGSLDHAYGPNLVRLAQVKRRYDPANVLHHNQNILPARDEAGAPASTAGR
ncbi:FAD-binding oxidoreductase [Capillimicrobium parvum]|uniref:6-hydroxy-D-nicotine oxidase n=1 Tax=Capillimicrobium parvum TaxID=2884022 RepID=A0A9E6XZ52_9ACTN|nr:FAD-binding oxidoreductase [Capillimicrobium parvum]UGS37001.1 6-hydroxy-D-nicotine oxidase [Capillimicrobium parvum]